MEDSINNDSMNQKPICRPSECISKGLWNRDQFTK